MLIEIIIVIILVGVDRLVKYLTVANLKENPVTLIENVFQLTYVENKGAAFGMLQNQRIFFIIITTVLVFGMIYIYLKIPKTKKYTLLRITIIFIFAGAIGNFVDRMVLGYVVDMFYFSLIDFAVFNVADSYIVVGSISLILLTLFYYKEDELSFIQLKRGKND